MDGTYKWYVFEVTKPTNYSEDNRRVLFTWKEADYQAGAREDAMDIIYNTFIKILRADFLHDRYEPIKSTQEDIIRDAGLSGSIKEYIDKYMGGGGYNKADRPTTGTGQPACKIIHNYGGKNHENGKEVSGRRPRRRSGTVRSDRLRQ